MESSKIPPWMRDSSYRDLEGDVRSARRLKRWALLVLVAAFAALSVATDRLYPEAFHLPVIAACLTAFAAMIFIPIESGFRIALAYWISAIVLNCLFVFIGKDMVSYFIALAVIILFTGLAGLLILSRTREKLSRAAKLATMCSLVAVYVVSLKFDLVPSEWLKIWLVAAIAPMTFLTVMTFVVLIGYHWKSATLPHHKWT